VHYRDSYIKPTSHIEFGDAIGVPLLSTETTECISSGSQHTRVEKIKIISAVELTYKALDVCVDPAHAQKINCSKCWKCLRTQLTLEVLGTLDRYKEAFDLSVYNKFRWIYICNALGSEEPLIKEVREEIIARNYEVPLSAQIVARFVPNKVIDLILQEWSLADTDNLFKLGWRVTRAITERLIRKLDKLYNQSRPSPNHSVAIPFTNINGSVGFADEKRPA
jgi:hypothetical protein